MNSEELELSLRNEFESHLKNVAVGMRQDVSQLQEQVEAEFSRHKSQIETFFQEFSARLDNDKELEGGFAETVIEHLRLARDEGARITATAFSEAEEMEKQSIAEMPPVAGINELSAAVSDIMAQDSQATILKSLVHQAAQFTPRGAFFIIKNEHFIGWRVFGKEGDLDEQSVREVFFPVASSTTLGESVRSLSAVESSFGTFADDSIYLNKLEFGQPDRMYAIPLVARGRGVAVLYADYGTKGEEANIEALETLVRVAGLTVEVLAAAPIAKPSQDFQTVAAPQQSVSDKSRDEYAVGEVESAKEFQSVADQSLAKQSEIAEEIAVSETEDYSTQPAAIADYQPVEKVEESPKVSIHEEEKAVEKTAFWSQPSEVKEVEADTKIYQSVFAEKDDVPIYQPAAAANDYSVPTRNDFQFAEPKNVEEEKVAAVEYPQFETTPFESPAIEPVESFSFKESYSNGKAEKPDAGMFEPVVSEPVVSEPVAAAPIKSRFSDRNVDLPIEVGEDERRLHNDARRFARLLISEIKLYNEQKVKEGREAQDLYERLREAIDRSRDMYDKRVQPPVAAKFDYFHYELVSSLAEGEEGKLGGNYPGAAV
ncbi:MAG: hypothetical protein LH614_02405 [Pyrinomonadaceae bacterium]|nr:hypothetical protein [Pyrinomonadaceae bacterium]